jgi:hypothetical protein
MFEKGGDCMETVLAATIALFNVGINELGEVAMAVLVTVAAGFILLCLVGMLAGGDK